MHDAVVADSEVDELIREIEVYLALVALLRQEGYEPRWAAERARSSPCEAPVSPK
jgi:hypothetical protein